MWTVQHLIDELELSPDSSFVRLVADWIRRATELEVVDLDYEPPLVDRDLFNVLAAAAVEHVCFLRNAVIPRWVAGPSRHLGQIWYGGYDALFANALVHTPISFSTRGILIEADSLESV